MFVSGTVRVLPFGEKGLRETTVNRLTDGDYFGEIGLLEGLPRTATVKAETDTVLYRIDGQDFLDAVTQAPVISGFLLGGVMRGWPARIPQTETSRRPPPFSRTRRTRALRPRN